jgi:hypothetical protein
LKDFCKVIIWNLFSRSSNWYKSKRSIWWWRKWVCRSNCTVKSHIHSDRWKCSLLQDKWNNSFSFEISMVVAYFYLWSLANWKWTEKSTQSSSWIFTKGSSSFQPDSHLCYV